MSTDKEIFEMEQKLEIPNSLKYYNEVDGNTAHDFTIAPINIEGKLNAMHFKKGWKRRFVVREMDGILHVSLNNNGTNFMIALFVIKERKLYAIAGIFSIHWASIKRTFKEEYENVEIIGSVYNYR